MPLASLYQKLLNMSRYFDGVAPLALRIYLVPVLMQAGYNKLAHFEDTVAWFANPDWGLGLPMPAVMAGLGREPSSLALSCYCLGSRRD